VYRVHQKVVPFDLFLIMHLRYFIAAQCYAYCSLYYGTVPFEYLSVTFVYSVKTYPQTVSPAASSVILVLPYKMFRKILIASP